MAKKKMVLEPVVEETEESALEAIKTLRNYSETTSARRALETLNAYIRQRGRENAALRVKLSGVRALKRALKADKKGR